MTDSALTGKQFEWVTGGDVNIKHEKLIDVGAYGEVHKLIDLSSLKPFARKLLRPFGFLTDKDLKNEVTAIDKICTQNHRNIVNVLRHNYIPNSPFYYIDMQLCDMNLDDYIYKPWSESLVNKTRFFRSEKQPIPIEWIILEEILSGLAFIHHVGLVHRDLKPRNILYCLEEDAWKLADFGATAEGTSKGKFTTVYSRGTPSYRAPELLTDTPFYNTKSDIWAVGCIFYELAAGKKAFFGDSGVERFAMSPTMLQIPDNRLRSPTRSGAGKEDMERLIGKMLLVDYKDRPSNLELQTACSTVQSMSETNDTTILLSKIQIPSFESAICLDDALFLLEIRTWNTTELQLWSGETGQVVGKFDLGPGRWTTSLDGRRYLSLNRKQNRKQSYLSMGQLAQNGITEDARMSLEDGGYLSCLTVSNEGDVAIGKSNDITVYTCQESQNHSYLLFEKVLNYERLKPNRVDMNGSLIYTRYAENVYILWNWRDSAVIKRIDMDSFLGVEWYKIDDVSNTHLLLPRWAEHGTGQFNLDLVDVESKKVLRLGPQTDFLSDVPPISRYGNFIATWYQAPLSDTDGLITQTINIWSIPSGNLVATVSEIVSDNYKELWRSVSISPSGSYLLAHSVSRSGATVRCWRIHYSDHSLDEIEGECPAIEDKNSGQQIAG